MVGTVIKSLVSQGKRVIIPDFGAFLIKDSTLSSILTKDNVTFSPFLKYNDGFLENELAHKYGLHKDDARLQVAAFVDAVKTSLNIDRKAYEVPGLGFFYKDKQGNAAFSIARPYDEPPVAVEDGLVETTVNDKPIEEEELVGKPVEENTGAIPSIVFSPAKADDAVPAPVVEISEEKPESVDEKVEKKAEKRVDHQASKASISKETTNERVEDSGRSNPSPRKKSRTLLVSFILLVGALLVLNFFWTDIFGTRTDASKSKIVLDPIDSEQKEAETEKVEAKEVAQDAIDNEVVATVEKAANASSSSAGKKAEKEVKQAEKSEKEPVKKVEKSADSKKVTSSDIKKETKEGSTGPKSFVVVLGSFETKESAEKHVDNLAKKKVKGHVIHRSAVYSVVTATFKTYEEAQKEKDHLKALGVDGWISSK